MLMRRACDGGVAAHELCAHIAQMRAPTDELRRRPAARHVCRRGGAHARRGGHAVDHPLVGVSASLPGCSLHVAVQRMLMQPCSLCGPGVQRICCATRVFACLHLQSQGHLLRRCAGGGGPATGPRLPRGRAQRRTQRRQGLLAAGMCADHRVHEASFCNTRCRCPMHEGAGVWQQITDSHHMNCRLEASATSWCRSAPLVHAEMPSACCRQTACGGTAARSMACTQVPC